jgi:phage-related protein
MEDKNIFKRLSQITSEITAVAKNLNVGWGKSSYKAVGEADVLAAVKPIESKNGVYSYPYSREIIESAVLTSAKADGTESKQQFLRVKTVYRFVNVDNPADYIDITTYGDGVDSQDKAPGKAMTYGDKYALLKAYKIITGDDPDQTASAPLNEKEQKPVQRQTISAEKRKALEIFLSQHSAPDDFVCKLYNVSELGDLTEKQHAHIVNNIQKLEDKYREAQEK